MNSIREKKEARRFTNVPILNRVKLCARKMVRVSGREEGGSLRMKYRELGEGGGVVFHLRLEATDPSIFLQGGRLTNIRPEWVTERCRTYISLCWYIRLMLNALCTKLLKNSVSLFENNYINPPQKVYILLAS